jgi:hypothetical protein
MDFDQLGETWRRRGGAGGSPVKALEAVQQRATSLRRIVRRRDRIEIGVALLMLPLFGWLAIASRNDVSRAGAAIVAVACALIPFRLRAARRPESDPGQPLLVRLRQELSQVEAQDRLLSSVAWWYLAPLGVGVILFVGGTASRTWGAVYAVVVIAVYTWLYHLNRRAVVTELQPRARELQDWISHLEQGN